MANPRGTFAADLLPDGWFDDTLRPEGWFSPDFLEPVVSGGGAIVATLNTNDSDDLLSSTSVLAIQATLSTTDAPDVGSGQASLALQATVGGIQGPDALAATASLASAAIVSDLNATDDSDTLVSTATLQTFQLRGGGGFRRQEHNVRQLQADDILAMKMIEEFLKVAA
jgi:hypothetical protein